MTSLHGSQSLHHLGYGYVIWLTLVGASLSELHTSVTALHMWVCMLVCLDRPLTVNFKWAHSNIWQWWNVHADLYFSKQLSKSPENEYERLLPDCRVAVKESKSEDNLSWMRIGSMHGNVVNYGTSLTIAWQGRLRVTLASDCQTAECTLASGTCLAWPLLHSRDPPASS